MAQVIKYIGRKTDFRGKPLWEILGNLKNHGVGRIVVRSMFERYPEPSYIKILKVEAVPNEENRKVRVTAERTFRGITQPKPVVLYSSTYKADYRLIPKDEEAEYCKFTPNQQQLILPNEIEFPPLFKEFVSQETGNQNPMMKLHFKKNINKQARLAEPGEKPTLDISMGLGKPISPKLYENCL